MTTRIASFRIAGQAVVKSGHGKVFEIKAVPGMGAVFGLTQGVEDFGGDVIELEYLRVRDMTDTTLGGLLNDALIEDKVIIAVGLTDSRCETTRRIEAYLNHHFCANGGRAIAVRYQ